MAQDHIGKAMIHFWVTPVISIAAMWVAVISVTFVVWRAVPFMGPFSATVLITVMSFATHAMMGMAVSQYRLAKASGML